MVIVVGEGEDGVVDLFAAPAAGGRFTRLTFTGAAEFLPELTPDGRRVGFVRQYRDSLVEVVILDLTTMAERRAPLPATAGFPVRLGWSPGGDSLIVADSLALFAVTGRELTVHPVAAAQQARAEWLSRERLGDPEFAVIRPCRAAAGYCAVADTAETPLSGQARDPIRWGTTAVAYIRSGGIEVRPLAGGAATRPSWTAAPRNLRQPTHHPGR
jgi:hypothetical protein